ncbi:MAG: hypothetical protein UW46_C0001G0123 [Candidatus Yanofskybacteria bacterium GW2011_GWF1_44_227]|uniref:SMODS and SLOG-associating 2TM effector domain-containing protein n=1 Tax=Candidatus Yanofskybacteria bacterium GW2011_GWE2_40_11 TaxID=1619033 RepID=A0A0G0QL65_9BACT|nr:MAG: hypothetical protein UT69_C0013G0052 [Candidatus Yanofskybacteria bacterium GW2011_GWE1_40_10]KKR41149.1 MAG: hypothetical protein UT75_C0001G0053 [Candidatus Yanofskybacteria bacterium GW2011_GWE2_40_11]KKT15854.1 MAG: hypothetical protein UV97_C0001G0027 [Candidatus Yanofskybacteria bacterium GW2011_GWF2_43_596]KKT53633.1 MAG: hypothetical protein UW46_C0001G0123 [Candidatus Yanofskybacteria bacterium GW2011_GWF1_44_227]OGN38579.1 MAG: hypothetical protein A2302_00710 [Candidatus Yano
MEYWYYTLSAIPQTLATMIALVATFGAVNLNMLSSKITEIRKDPRIRRFILLGTSQLDKEIHATEIHQIDALTNNDYLSLFQKCLDRLDPRSETLGLEGKIFEKYKAEMLEVIHSEWHSFYGPDPDRIYGYLSMKRDVLKMSVLDKKKIINNLGLSLSLAVLTIVISLLALPNYDYFCGSTLLVSSVVILAVLSVALTGWGVWIVANLESRN